MGTFSCSSAMARLFVRNDLRSEKLQGATKRGCATLTPLCTELRTEAGALDIAFINQFGRLTLVECKLWRNPEARRKVVAQALD